MAATDIERLQVLVEANTAAYAKAMQKLQADTNRAIRASNASVASLDARLKTLGATVNRVAGIFGIAFGVTALAGFIKSSIEAGSAIGDMADKLGISAEALQQWTYVAKLNGSSQEALIAGFRGMTKVLQAAADGNKEAQQTFADLGISFQDIKDKNPEQVFELLLDRIGRIEDPLRRNAELMKVFGKSGTDLASVAALGADKIDSLKQEASKLGLVLDSETIRKAQDAGDELDTIAQAAQAAGIKIAAEFLPAITAIADLMTSQAFQDGLGFVAGKLASITTFIAQHGDLIARLGGAMLGARIAGPVGAAAGLMAPEMFGAPIVQPANPISDRFNDAFGGAAVAAPAHPSITVTGSGAGPGRTGGWGGWRSPDADQAAKKIKDVTDALNLQLANLTRTDREQEIYNELAKAGTDANTEAGAKIAELTGRLYDQKKAFADANAEAQFFGQTAYDAIDGLILKGETFGDVVKNIVVQLAEAALQASLLGTGPLAGLFGTASASGKGIGGILGGLFNGLLGLGHAAGGPVSRGRMYPVGERGPELFVPSTAGRVVPANQNQAGGDRGPITLQVIVNGARGNAEIRQMVVEGASEVIAQHDRQQSRQQARGG